jgi:hypothetical protein
MALSTEDLYDKALAMSEDVEDNFIELGRHLRQLQDRDLNLFQQIMQNTNLGRRKAYYLVEVSRIFDPLPIPRSRLRKIGWTKLQLIGKHIDASNLDKMLELAENNNSKELERILRGDKPLGGKAHCVLMYFSPKQYHELEEVLIQHGATRSTGSGGRTGLSNKESALMNLIRSLKGGGKEPVHSN